MCVCVYVVFVYVCVYFSNQLCTYRCVACMCVRVCVYMRVCVCMYIRVCVFLFLNLYCVCMYVCVCVSGKVFALPLFRIVNPSMNDWFNNLTFPRPKFFNSKLRFDKLDHNLKQLFALKPSGNRSITVSLQDVRGSYLCCAGNLGRDPKSRQIIIDKFNPRTSQWRMIVLGDRKAGAQEFYQPVSTPFKLDWESRKGREMLAMFVHADADTGYSDAYVLRPLQRSLCVNRQDCSSKIALPPYRATHRMLDGLFCVKAGVKSFLVHSPVVNDEKTSSAVYTVKKDVFNQIIPGLKSFFAALNNGSDANGWINSATGATREALSVFTKTICRIVHEICMQEQKNNTCTCKYSGIVPMLQPWRFCAACGMGMCSVCARKCHHTHVVTDEGRQLRTCECGKGNCPTNPGVKFINHLKAVKLSDNSVRGLFNLYAPVDLGEVWNIVSLREFLFDLQEAFGKPRIVPDCMLSEARYEIRASPFNPVRPSPATVVVNLKPEEKSTNQSKQIPDLKMISMYFRQFNMSKLHKVVSQTVRLQPLEHTVIVPNFELQIKGSEVRSYFSGFGAIKQLYVARTAFFTQGLCTFKSAKDVDKLMKSMVKKSATSTSDTGSALRCIRYAGHEFPYRDPSKRRAREAELSARQDAKEKRAAQAAATKRQRAKDDERRRRMKYTYTATIQTGKKLGAGTDAAVYIRVFGVNRFRFQASPKIKVLFVCVRD